MPDEKNERAQFEMLKVGARIKCSCNRLEGGGDPATILEEAREHMRAGCTATITLTYDPNPHWVELDGTPIPWSWEKT